MKKYFLRFLLIFVIMCQVMLGSCPLKCSAENVADGEVINVMSNESYLGLAKSKSERVIRKMVFGNGIEYVVEITFSPESISKLDGETHIYKKSMNMKGTYFMNIKGKPLKELASHKFKVTFTYDKKSFCEIYDAKEDIVCESQRSPDEKWKIKQNNEILSSKDESICTVSLISNLYKNPKMSTKSVYYENSHMDFICSKNGNVVLNSNIF